jgi:tripartite-type tricarboxylate transporter receptor subunit TctC
LNAFGDAPIAWAQAAPWPLRPVRIVTFGPSRAAPDLVARIWSGKFSRRWNQPIVIDNKPGGDGVIVAQAMLAAKYGHTLFEPNFIYTSLHHTNSDPVVHEIKPPTEAPALYTYLSGQFWKRSLIWP